MNVTPGAPTEICAERPEPGRQLNGMVKGYPQSGVLVVEVGLDPLLDDMRSFGVVLMTLGYIKVFFCSWLGMFGVQDSSRFLLLQ